MTKIDYTFKYNAKKGRHGWLRLTPAYSIALVKEILQQNDFFSSQAPSRNILDPFCGTATTGLVAAEMGLNCTLYDINPFLVWFCRIKSKNFNSNALDKIAETVQSDLTSLKLEKDNYWIPPMKNINRWWSNETLNALSTLRNYIITHWGVPNDADDYNLLWIAFAKLCIEISAADFNHISVSFKEETSKQKWTETKKTFVSILFAMLESAKIKFKGNITILEGDSRLLKYDGKYDTVITSPPYPNRISYIRELRPYMYWLNFLQSGEEAGELDWKAIGGTWGSATSRLNDWTQTNKHLPKQLINACEKIQNCDEKNSETMAKYVLKFFDDMYQHLSNLRKHLLPKASINYILGNSSFYGHFVETDIIIKEMLQNLGFEHIESKILRKRNSKANLYEYLISAKYDI